MDLRLLRYFVALAEERNFTSAARRLNVSQPALSQQLQLLERRLGAQLVDRATQPIRLTAAGEELLVGARRILQGVNDLDTSVRALGSGRAGSLRVGVTWGGLYDLMMPALRSLAEGRPGLQLSVVQLGGLDQLSALRRDEVDVVLHRETHFESYVALERRVLFDDPLIAMLPPGHPAGVTGRVRLADLAGEQLVMISRIGKPLVFDRCLQLCRDAGFEPNVIAEVYEPMALAVAVAAQRMVGLSGAGMANRYPGVDYLPVTPTTGIAPVSVVWNPGTANPLVAAFVSRLDPATITGPVEVAMEAAMALEVAAGSPV